jgi:ABC-2 type transport system permease protein
MTSAAFFLVTRNIKNRVVRSIVRLRQPRYVLGAAMAGFYIWSFFIRKGATRAGAAMGPALYVEMMSFVVALIALVLLVGAWALPSAGPGLVFTEAEIQFFFAGPVSRRQLIAYKVVRSQLQTLFTSIVFTFVAFRGSHFLGLWITFMGFDVYLTFASFARVRLQQAGIGWMWRVVILSIVVSLGASAIYHQIGSSSDMIAKALTDRQRFSFLRVVPTVAATPPLSTILTVPRFISRAVYGASPVLPCVVIIAVAFALFFVTTQLDVAFEDSSIIASQRAMTRRARMRGMRSGRSAVAVNRIPPPFKLAQQGRPEIALIWKNLIGTLRISGFPLVAVIIPLAIAAVGGVFRNSRHLPDILGLFGLMSTAIFVFAGPRAVRTDLRTDILRLDMIKTFPLSAESLLIGEIAASLIVISIGEFLLLLASVTVLQFGQSKQLAFFTTPEFIVSALVFMIPISAIQLLIQNGAVILFPAWNLSTDQGRFSALGQRMLMFLGNIITLALSLIPAAIVFLPTMYFVGRTPIGVLAATVVPAGILVAEIYIAVKLLANQFEEIDIANDLDAVA